VAHPTPDDPRTDDSKDQVTRLNKPVSTSSKETAAMAKGWSIAMNFVYGVIGMGLLGWALQTYVWKSTAPWLLVTFLGLGLVGSFYKFIRDGMAAANE